MYPFFFGEKNSRLYGIYEEPSGMQDHSHGILMCYPMGHEYMRGHFSFRRLAAMLAQRGFHNMRFDYYGTGDSAGLCSEIKMSTCLDSLASAAEEFRDISSVSKMYILGLRFGGLLALMSTVEHVKAESIILWDPIVDGKSYIKELSKLHQQMKTQDSFRIPGGCPPFRKVADIEELVCYEYSEKYIAEIEKLSLLDMDFTDVNRVFLYVSREDKLFINLHQMLCDQGVEVDYHFIPDAGDWEVPSQIDQMFMPSSIINALADALLPKPETR